MIAFMFNELWDNEQICPQSIEAEIPTLLKVTVGAAAQPVDGNTG